MEYTKSELKNIQIDFCKNKIIFLHGDLGAGKTTCVQTFLKHQLGVNEPITSPTYTYYNMYGKNIYHFDLYRLSVYDEFFAIGGEEILDSGAICLIEWPGILQGYYEPDLEIFITNGVSEDLREVILQEK